MKYLHDDQKRGSAQGPNEQSKQTDYQPLAPWYKGVSGWFKEGRDWMRKHREKYLEEHWMMFCKAMRAADFGAIDRWYGLQEQQLVIEEAIKREAFDVDMLQPLLYINQNTRQHIENTKALYRWIERAPSFAIPAHLHRRDEREQIALLMHIKLSIWLCTYFFGIPRFDAWEEAVDLARILGAFPGDAFLYKSAGDIYRMERRQGITAALQAFPADKAQKSGQMRVMSTVGPLALVQTKGDPHLTARTLALPGLQGAANDDEARVLFSFLREVTLLAHRYLRLHMMRYLSCRIPTQDLASGTAQFLAIDYGVDYFNFWRSLQALAADMTLLAAAPDGQLPADVLLAQAKRVTSQNITALTREQLEDKQLFADALLAQTNRVTLQDIKNLTAEQIEEMHFRRSRNSPEAEKRHCELRANLIKASPPVYNDYLQHLTQESDKLAKVFFSGRSPKNQRLVMFGHELTKKLGVIASVMGSTVGVASNTFGSSRDWTRCCFWIDGLLGAVEREKLRVLWSKVQETKEGEDAASPKYIPFDNHQPFSGRWKELRPKQDPVTPS